MTNTMGNLNVNNMKVKRDMDGYNKKINKIYPTDHQHHIWELTGYLREAEA